MISHLFKKAEDVLIRPLNTDDRVELEAIIARDPVAFLYAYEQLERLGLPAPSALNSYAYRSPYGFMGIFEPVQKDAEDNNPLQVDSTAGIRGIWEKIVPTVQKTRSLVLGQRLAPGTAIPGTPEELQPLSHDAPSYRLVGAFWMGTNCVPIAIQPQHIRVAAAMITRASKNIASIFGAQAEVMQLWELLKNRMTLPLSVREDQPLMLLAPQQNLGKLLRSSLHRDYAVPQIEENVRWARTTDRVTLLRASIAMFTEEIGYDPMTRDPRGYAQRVDDYIRSGRTVVATNRDGVVVFKADIGLAHADICQLQGVWLHPAYRGQGLSASLLAQACELIRPRFPQISLYVNSYNERALALYRSVGFEQVGSFASILF